MLRALCACIKDLTEDAADKYLPSSLGDIILEEEGEEKADHGAGDGRLPDALGDMLKKNLLTIRGRRALFKDAIGQVRTCLLVY